MRDKYAVWSWVFSVIALVLYSIVLRILGTMRKTAGIGSPITSPERIIGIVFSLIFLLIIITGFIFAIVGLRRIKKDSNLTGMAHAIVGIILNSLLFFFGLLILGSSLLGG